MREHKLALCAAHYLEWFQSQTLRSIRKYDMAAPGARILVAVSGGKDSLGLWDVLLALGYAADGLYIDLGIDGGFEYSRRSREKAEAFAAQRPELSLHIVDLVALYGVGIYEAARRHNRVDRPCSVCGLIKRHEMNRVAFELGYDVLVTGHNLDDEVAALFGNVLSWHAGYLRRQAPVLPADAQGLVRKAKPFCRLYERETAAYALLRSIDYIEAECPYAKGSTTIAHKATLTQMEHNLPGTKLSFYSSFLAAKEAGLFSPEHAGSAAMRPCPRCGQPTTTSGLCSFCRLWEPLEQPS